MAKYQCPYCPYFVHTSGGIPNHNEWLLLSAVEHDALPEVVDRSDLYGRSLMLYKCISCNAIAIFWSGFEHDPTWYAALKQPESR
jgi:DNA-directed RNA polymerase subunit RPC12/RpoP